MDIVVDNRERCSKYFDVVNLHYAENNEILKLVDEDCNSPLKTFVKLVSSSLNLKDEEERVLYTIYKNNDNLFINYIRDKYIKTTDKSISTFQRAINTLIHKNIIRIIAKNNIIINEVYKLPNDINNVRFIVIELRNK